MFKSFRKIGLMLPLVFALGACQELEQEVLDGVTAEDIAASKNPNLINVLKASAYARIVGSWGGHNSIWSIQEVSSDEMAIPQKGADWEDGGQWLRMHRHTWNPTEESFNNSWAYCYSAIGEINNLIGQYPNLTALTSELKVLRAFVYLWLIDSFGNVPIIDENSKGGNPTNNTRAQVFAFIEKSIKDNINALPKTAGSKYYINFYTAQAILAKLYLNAEVYTGTARWAEAEAAADAVINSGVYSLTSNYFTNFSERNGGSTENILTLPYDENNAGGFNLAMMTLHYLSQNTYNLSSQPWNGYASLEEFYNSYDDADVRKKSFIAGPQFSATGARLNDLSAEPSDPDGQPLTFTPKINQLAPNAFRQAGVRVGKYEFGNGAGSNLNNDYPLIRLGEIILIKSEAALRQGKAAVALTAVNQIRTRAGMPAYTSINLDELYNERGREMFAEATRRSDAIRFGKWNLPWWEKQASQPFRALFPIPQQQINANPSLKQNPGY
jgi:hypothetical protein